MKNNDVDLINRLLDKHMSKFKYPLYFIAPTGHFIDEFLFGTKNNEVIEFMNLLQKSIDEGIDYLPEKYEFDPKDFEGDINADVIN